MPSFINIVFKLCLWEGIDLGGGEDRYEREIQGVLDGFTHGALKLHRSDN